MITLEIDDDDFHRGLGRLLKNATNARPMMRAIATEMTSNHRRQLRAGKLRQ